MKPLGLVVLGALFASLFVSGCSRESEAPATSPSRDLAPALTADGEASPDPGAAPRTRILLVGVDGATWDLIEPRLAAGELPTVRALLDRGTRATLLVEPGQDKSGPSWTTIASGKLAAKHHIRSNRGTVRVARFWDALGAHGERSAVIGWVLGKPSYEFDGVLLSGPFCPFDDRRSSPPGLLAELEAELGPYRPDADLRGFGDGFVESVRTSTEQQLRYAETLLERGPWSILAVIFTGSDRLQHYYWRYRYPESYGLDPESEEVRRKGEVIDEFYRQFDTALARLLSRIDLSETTLLIVSDHGFQSRSPWRLRRSELELDYFLREAGWLNLDADHRIVREQTRAWEIDDRDLPERTGKTKTRARSIRVPDPSLRAEVRDLFREARLVRTGQPLFGRVRIMDDRVQVETGQGDEPLFADHIGLRIGGEPIEILADKLARRSALRSGMHDDRGILLAAGPGIRRGVRSEPIDNVQITPTILAIRGLPLASDMDGGVAEELFEPDALPPRPPPVESYDAFVPDFEEPEDDSAIIDRLRGLGYVE